MKKLILMIILGMTIGANAAVKTGEAAPDFTAASTKGEVKLSDYKGKWLVVYFYPKSFTGGCTKQSCSLRDGYEDIQKTGAEILGVSVDPVDTQKKFKEEHKLPFEIIADTDKKVTKAYDVLMVGGMMSSRYTFIINPEGKIAHVFDKVNTATHKDQVLEVLKQLQAAK